MKIGQVWPPKEPSDIKGNKMKNFKIVLDVTSVYYADIEADTEAEAMEIAEKEAYQDTWSCKAIYSGVELVEAEEEYEESTEEREVREYEQDCVKGVLF